MGEFWKKNPFFPTGVIDPMTQVAKLVLRSSMDDAVCEMVLIFWTGGTYNMMIFPVTLLKHYHVYKSFFSLSYL